jgi:sugar lactone lactonase YvrE
VRSPHIPENGKVLALDPDAATTTEVAWGMRLPDDIEYGCCGVLYVLSQGEFEEGNPDGAPAMPNTGSLVAVNGDGTVSVLMEELNLLTSL